MSKTVTKSPQLSVHSMSAPPVVELSPPLADLPSPERTGNYEPAPHWMSVRSALLETPGMWRAVKISHLSEDRRRCVPSEVRKGNLAAFREPGFEAVFRNGSLYMRAVAA
ncbi:hypothetical protein [Arthrobacter woluwensis]|uniref:Uncharacterized protein n=1 Tax=Arthrobacter woluwensis TaxID=156980 RepID=A0A1H4W8H1_9MICC|nr:hypothetical protein [Arthrobacter woluwensis]SEC89380.1 hypothetical protein SAMN04489745_3444 [Arthrobacter woluwensis]SEC96173.1 hypothetical protein SAMN04489745_3560 [Arthrobacter woluwensis]